jgi:hypothetical protein
VGHDWGIHVRRSRLSVPMMPFGSAQIESNSQCSLNASSSYVSISGSSAYVYFSVTFKSPFEGARNVRVRCCGHDAHLHCRLAWYGVSQCAGRGSRSPQIISVSFPFGVARQADLRQFAVKLRDSSGGLADVAPGIHVAQGNTWNTRSSFTPGSRFPLQPTFP